MEIDSVGMAGGNILYNHYSVGLILSTYAVIILTAAFVVKEFIVTGIGNTFGIPEGGTNTVPIGI